MMKKLQNGLIPGVFILGGLSVAYYIYDLVSPDHFVGDMYGMEVIMRSFLLLATAGPFLLGVILVCFGSVRKIRKLRIAGNMIVITASVILAVMAFGVAADRHRSDIRRGYHQKTAEELIRIARSEKDVYAIDVIIIKKAYKAEPYLCEMLLDEKEVMMLRIAAAQALGELGGVLAKDALEKAKTVSQDEYFVNTAKSALESVKGRKQ